MEQEQFVDMLKAEGYAGPVSVTREPGGMLDSHVHPFEAKALILDGEIRIGTGNGARTYRRGEIFHLQANEAHTESYGPQGVRYLVGRRQ
ncbi:cupin domain-containing protein [Noviherbaspirillum aridicola]|uniref:Cupin n=1 Tax=Noviherbaspirillum aridicola TaxID=2849687 RepID=A0ABQ4PZA9_9BURK|nr:cupin [Noviherbaspirillum aridicola]GIZ50091.1 hypothetical protein NCCP691_01050 [Noviherbaspirillum aridicola]